MSAPDLRLEHASRLFLRYQPVLRAFIYSLVRHAADADDLLQEVGVFVLSRGAEAPTVPAEFATWCRTVARHRIMHHWRSQRRVRGVPSERLAELVDQAYAEAAPGPDQVSTRQRALGECLGRVSEPMRHLLKLRYLDGLNSDEIGDRTRRSAASVRMALMRARDLLARCLDRRLRTAGGEA
jgi:RNA polymerase sigma-70 factor (ECF subfamily)